MPAPSMSPTVNIHIVTFENLFVRVQIASCQVEISATGKATAGTKGDKVGWDTGDSEKRLT